MNRLIPFVMAAVLMLGDRALAQPSSEDAELRAAMKRWMTERYGVSALQENIDRGLRDVDQRLAAGRDVEVIFGAGATSDGKPALAFTWEGTAHAFPLTLDQMRATGTGTMGVTVAGMGAMERHRHASPVPLRFEPIQLDEPNKLSADKAITGTVICRPKAGDYKGDTLTLHVNWRNCATNIGAAAITQLGKLPADGKIAWKIGPLNANLEDVNFGPTIVVIDLIAESEQDPRGELVASSVAALIDVPPDTETYIRGGLKLMKDVTALLASVQDRASADAAIPKYKALILGNLALADAYKRMGQVSPEVERELMLKYEASMRDASQAMGAEMQRVQQASYAGPAFIDRLDAAAKEVQAK